MIKYIKLGLVAVMVLEVFSMFYSIYSYNKFIDNLDKTMFVSSVYPKRHHATSTPDLDPLLTE